MAKHVATNAATPGSDRPDVVVARRIEDRAWFERHPVRVAFDLIGTIFQVERDGNKVSGRIVEVEAYAGPQDLASHASRMKAARVLLSGKPGTLYMYRSYGIHTMLNVVAHEPDMTGAVLIRGMEPISGIEIMRERRGVAAKPLLTGPGVLTQTLALRLADLGQDMCESTELSLRLDSGFSLPIGASSRIGISRGLSADWRFFAPDAPGVSVHRKGRIITRDDLDGMILPEGTMVE